MININSNIWNKAGVSVICVPENDDVNKTLLRLLCIYGINKRWGGKNIYELIDKKVKGKYEVKNTNEFTKLQIRKYKQDFLKVVSILCTFMKILQLE